MDGESNVVRANFRLRPASTPFNGSLLEGGSLYWEHAFEGLFVVRVLGPREFQFAGINPSLERMSGLTVATFVGRTPEQVLSPADAAKVSRHYRRCVRRGTPLSYAEVLDVPEGRKHWRTNLVPVRGADGQIVRLLGSTRDVSEQVATLDSVLRTQLALQGTLDALSAQVALLDTSGIVLSVNRAWQMFGEQRGATTDFVGANYLAVCASAASGGDLDAAIIGAKLAAVLRGELGEFEHAYRCLDRHFKLHCIRVPAARERHVVVAHEDITDAVRAQRQLAVVTQRLIDVQEEERRRIALELHDSTSQHLVAIQLGLSAIERGNPVPPLVAQMQTSITEAQREIRTLSYLLHPPSLAEKGLRLALQSFATGFAARTGRETSVSVRGAVNKLPPEVQRAVFRIVQEAFTNVARHSNANRVTLSLVRDAAGLQLAVADNGICRRGAHFVAGVGLTGMDARVRQFGGELQVIVEDIGVTIRASFPACGIAAAEAATREPAPDSGWSRPGI
ncbi:PAS domain-containing protein [Sphingomonas sp. DT-207]|uniref:PAS domain-containing sensor histidine kinase n=1 Tax=Sphingomonas sp. DT-207 TaxID=3396167 RepID=UPI003F1D0E94